jgi:hypothetical protein
VIDAVRARVNDLAQTCDRLRRLPESGAAAPLPGLLVGRLGVSVGEAAGRLGRWAEAPEAGQREQRRT